MVSGRRAYTGRTLPELTQAIVGVLLRPPSIFNTELAPEFEKILLKAMARNRDERYGHATLMAQALRELGLRPSAIPVVRDSRPPAPTRGPRVIHPPKRPNVKRRRYLELEETQPPPGESRERSPWQPQTEPAHERPSTLNRVTGHQDELPPSPLRHIPTVAPPPDQ